MTTSGAGEETDDTLVSVIVPVFNVKPFLRRCVGSVLHQSHSNLDVILIDDGSTDGSSEVCDDLAREDARIRVIHQQNGGLSHARNVGVGVARGSVLTFLDSDDWIHPSMVATLLRSAAQTGAEVACCHFARVWQDDESVMALASDCPAVLEGPQVMEELVGRMHTILTVACAKLYATHLWEGVTFPQGRLHEDEFTTYRVLHKANRVSVVDQALYYYRQHSRSITGSPFTEARGRAMIDAFEGRALFLEEAGLTALAQATREQTFRKYIQLYGWSGADDSLRRELLLRMRGLLRTFRGPVVSPTFVIFSRTYVLLPSLMRRVYLLQARLRGLRVYT